MIHRIALLEAKKLSTYKPFWAIIAFYAIGPATFLWLLNNVSGMEFQEKQIAINYVFIYPNIWINLAWMSKFTSFLISLLLILLISNQFEYRTLLQHVIDGFSRSKILIGQFLLIILFSAFILAVIIALGLLFGVEGNDKPFINDVAYQSFIGIFFYNIINFMFVVLVTLVLRRAVYAVFFIIAWQVILEPLLGLILNQLSGLSLQQYLPHAVLSNIVPKATFFAVFLKTPQTVPPEVWALAGFYGVLFAGLSWVALEYRDL